MFGTKKKNNEGQLPDLPNSGAPSMRDYQRTMLPPIGNENPEEIHGLPSFPDSLMNKGFSQSMIKSAVEDEDKNLPELPEWNNGGEKSSMQRTTELNEWSPKKVMSQEMPVQREPIKSNNNQIDYKRPIFVKLDKFKEARESLIKISEKLEQMDELLKTVRDLKAKEDEEISGWEKDVESIKSRILFINKEIFENAY
jgi:hypothetical protein